MNGAKKHIVDSTQQIFDLYCDHVDVKEAVELMRDQGVSSRLVKYFYYKLSRDAEKLTMEIFHYYTTEVNNARCWTSRYLFACNSKSAKLYDIQIIDVFNDKSM
jgi:hypothetical protein